MEDHQYTAFNDECIDNPIMNVEYSSENVVIEEKEGDEFLIELYRERKFLYDKSHRNFKNKQIKENAWAEISIIMQQKNLGKHYTPEYCQLRCTSLRDQYNREKRNIKDDCKSGSAYSKRKTFAFFNQLSFLDNFIKRRNTFSNIKRKKNILQSIKNTEAETHEKNSNNESTDESNYEQQDAIKISQKRNINASQDTFQDTENLEQDVFQDMENLEQDVFQDMENLEHVNKRSEKINASKFKRRKINESKSIDDTFTNISTAIMNFLENTKENTTTNNITTVDQSFVDYIRVHLESIPEPEKSARKKMIFDALTAPLPKTYIFFKHHCTCKILMEQLFHHLAAIFK